MVYLLYRWIIALYFFVWLIANGATAGSGAKFFIWLSNWTYLLVVAHLLYSALCCTYVHLKFAFCRSESDHKRHLQHKDLHDPPHYKTKCCLCFQCLDKDQISWYHIPQWIGHYLAAVIPVPVVIFYWALLADNITGWAVNLHLHLFVALPGVIDSLACGIPWRVYHVHISMIFGIVYFVFSLAYDLLGGTDTNGDSYIYSSLDYTESPAGAFGFAFVLIVLFIPFIHFIFWSLYILRTLLLYCKIGRSQQHETSYSVPKEEYRTRKISQEPLTASIDLEIPDNHALSKNPIGEVNPAFAMVEHPPQSPN